jgi:hypothetical protein
MIASLPSKQPNESVAVWQARSLESIARSFMRTVELLERIEVPLETFEVIEAEFEPGETISEKRE